MKPTKCSVWVHRNIENILSKIPPNGRPRYFGDDAAGNQQHIEKIHAFAAVDLIKSKHLTGTRQTTGITWSTKTKKRVSHADLEMEDLKRALIFVRTAVGTGDLSTN